MSFQPPPRIPRPIPRPAPARRLRAVPGEGSGKGSGWGWLEWFAVSQTLLPALLFVPGLTAVRTPSRIAAYVIAPLAWAFVALRGRPGPGSNTFPARPWLIGCVVWLVLSVVHPNSFSLVAAAAQASLYISILSPGLWAPAAVRSSTQVRRVLTILFLCNALSALVGLAQVFRPQTFNPPVIPAMNNAYEGQDLMYEIGDGRKILRPCGLTDTPGAAAQAGMAATLIGLCWILRPTAAWKRLASLMLAFVGIAVIYYSQVRFTLVMLAVCLFALLVLLVLQRNLRQAFLLTALGMALLVGASLWVSRSAGSVVIDRFLTLVQGDPGKLYHESRGRFVQHAFEEVLGRYPLGYGMGWWGMIQVSFGNPNRPSPVWVEVMWPAWIYDGGFPLLIGYVVALAMAMFDSTRIALTCRDRELAYWAAVIVAFNLSILATCFSYVTFLSPLGLQFWLLAGALHAADARTRLVKPAPGNG